MLVLSMVILGIISIILLVLRRDIIALYMVGMSICFIIMYVGIIIYIAKIGDFNEGQRVFLFLSPKIKVRLQYLPWTLSRIGFLVAFGRTLFPYFLLRASLEFTMIPYIRRRKNILGNFMLIIPIVLLIYYYPPIFKILVSGRFYLLQSMIYISRLFIVVYVILSILIIVIEYISITMLYCKKNLRFSILGIFGMTALYSVYAIQDPAQIYHFYIYEYIDINSLMYINPTVVKYGYVVVGILSIIFVLTCVMGISGYIYHDVKEERISKKLKEHFKTRSLGISVFSHSIKNELLASRILIKKIYKELEESEIDNPNIKKYLQQLQDYNEDTLGNMNRYYKVMSAHTVHLKPIAIDDILDIAVEHFIKRYGEKNIKVCREVSGMILGDIEQLPTAISNIMDNGYEASNDTIHVQVVNERLYFVIKIKDNGKGMDKKEIKNIFRPFFTSKINSSSWGLGLYFTHIIVKKHYGYIKINSKVGSGSEFYVMLPKYVE